MKTEITPLKLARYPELLVGPPRPIHWDVDPSSVCDHRCRGCPYIFDGETDPMLGVRRPEVVKEKRGFLDSHEFESFVTEAKSLGAKAVTFVGGGEPTLHPGFPFMMEVVHAWGLKFGVVTHFGREYSRAFFDAVGLATWIRVSVNAGSPQTYLHHQGRDHFTRVLFNMAYIAASAPACRVGMSFLITNDNYREIVVAASRAKSAGAKYIQYKPIIEVDLGKAYEGIETQIVAELDAARRLADDNFQVIDQWAGRLEELRRHARGEFSGRCHVPRFNPKLGANGVVYTCCELAYSDEGAIGSIYEESLSTILERAGEKIMDQHGCPHCWDKPLNTLINEGRFHEIVAPSGSVDQEFV